MRHRLERRLGFQTMRPSSGAPTGICARSNRPPTFPDRGASHLHNARQRGQRQRRSLFFPLTLPYGAHFRSHRRSLQGMHHSPQSALLGATPWDSCIWANLSVALQGAAALQPAPTCMFAREAPLAAPSATMAKLPTSGMPLALLASRNHSARKSKSARMRGSRCLALG